MWVSSTSPRGWRPHTNDLMPEKQSSSVSHPASVAVVSEFCIERQPRMPPGHRLCELGGFALLDKKDSAISIPAETPATVVIFLPVATHSSTGIAPTNPRTNSTLANASSRACLSGGPRPPLKRTGVYRPNGCRCSISCLYPVEDLFIGHIVTHIGRTEDQ